MKYVFQPGDRGKLSWNLGVEYGGKLFTVVEGLKDRVWRSDGKLYASYVVKIDYDTEPLEIKAHNLELMKPERGDLDQKAGWDMLPHGVVRAMKEGPREEAR